MKRELIAAMMLVLLVAQAAYAMPQTETIWGKAKVGEVGVRGVTVKLYSVDGKEVSSQKTGEGGFFSFDVTPGTYYLVHPSEKKGQILYLTSKSGTVFVDPRDDVTGYRMDLNLEAVSLNRTLTVRVVFGTDPVEGANVTVSHLNSDFEEYAETNETGYATFTLFQGKFLVTASTEFYVQSAYADLTTGNCNIEIDLSGSKTLFQADIVEENGDPVSTNVRITGVTEDGVIFLQDKGPFVSFSVPNGTTFQYLVLSPDGYTPYVLKDFTMDGSVYLENVVVKKAEDSYHYKFVMVDNETLQVQLEERLSVSAILDFLPYDFIGYLPLQLQLAGVSDLEGVLRGMGPWLAVSYPLFTIETENGSAYYTLQSYSVEVSEEGGGYDVLYTFSMVAAGDPDLSNGFTVSMRLMGDSYKGGYRNYTYEVVLPEGYERSSEVHNVKVEGYTDILIDPGTAESVNLEFDVSPSTPPEPHFAVIKVQDGKFYAINATKQGYEVIVPQGKEVEFDASPTEDKESLKIVEYRWDFNGDGVFDFESGSPYANWTFDSEGVYNVTLNVTDSGGLSNQSTYKVHVDGTPPTIKLTYQGEELSDGQHLYVDEGTPVNLFAYGSTDNEVAPLSFNWSFSDGAQYSGPNVTHVFEKPTRDDELFYLNLTVEDGVGNAANMTIKFTVNDTTPPTISMRFLKGGVEVEQIQQGETVVLDLSGSEDPEGGSIKEFRITVSKGGEELNLSSGEVQISAENGHVENSTIYVVPGSVLNVTMTFNKYGLYTIKVNATDECGNSAEMTKNLQVKIGPSPDMTLEVNASVLSDLKEGQEVSLNVTVRNIGVSDATGVYVVLYIDDEEVGNVTVGDVAKDGSANATFTFKVPKAGNHTVKVVVHADNEAEAYTDNNEFVRDIVVKPAAWKKPLMITAVIIAVIVALFLFFRRPSAPKRRKRSISKK